MSLLRPHPIAPPGREGESDAFRLCGDAFRVIEGISQSGSGMEWRGAELQSGAGGERRKGKSEEGGLSRKMTPLEEATVIVVSFG